MSNIPLVKLGHFKTHNGLQLPWKIDCDALSNETIEQFALIISWRYQFSRVIGVPRGGLRLAEACQKYVRFPEQQLYPTLIVDDVLTTGKSMEETRHTYTLNTPRIGVVIFARGPTPPWVRSIFNVSDTFNTFNTSSL